MGLLQEMYIRSPWPAPWEEAEALDFYFGCCGRYLYFKRKATIFSACKKIAEASIHLDPDEVAGLSGGLQPTQFSEESFFTLFGWCSLIPPNWSGDVMALECEPILYPSCTEEAFGPLLQGLVPRFKAALFMTSHILMEVHDVTERTYPNIWNKFRLKFPFHTPYRSEGGDLHRPVNFLREGVMKLERLETIHFLKCFVSVVFRWLETQGPEGPQIARALYEQIKQDYYDPKSPEISWTRYFESVYNIEIT